MVDTKVRTACRALAAWEIGMAEIGDVFADMIESGDPLAWVRKHIDETDPGGYVERARKAVEDIAGLYAAARKDD